MHCFVLGIVCCLSFCILFCCFILLVINCRSSNGVVIVLASMSSGHFNVYGWVSLFFLVPRTVLSTVCSDLLRSEWVSSPWKLYQRTALAVHLCVYLFYTFPFSWLVLYVGLCSWLNHGLMDSPFILPSVWRMLNTAPWLKW